MQKKHKLMGLAIGVVVLLALGLGGAVMAADDRDPALAGCPGLNGERGEGLGVCARWGEAGEGVCPNGDAACDGVACLNEDGERVCPNGDAACDGTACLNEDGERVCPNGDAACDGTGCLANGGEGTAAGNCWRGAQAERSCDQASESVAAGAGCMRGRR